ncbi:MAG TPA: nucleotidyltransferase family protein [Bacillota bacterium]|nr:nucleotidyltransferase family protein [Bacillota bacterium]
MDALILAGGREKSFSKDNAMDAAFAINGESMLDRVVQAIAGTHHFDRIIVVGLREALSLENHGLVSTFIEPQATMVENLQAGLKTVNPDQLVLITASDIPLLNNGAVESFLQQCAVRPDAQIYYPVIPQEAFGGGSHKIRRTFLRLRDGVFTGGNMVLARPKLILEHMDLVSRIIELRKYPQQWGKLFGWGHFTKGLLLGATLSDIERWVEERLKIKGVAVRCHSLGIGLDADTKEDIDWIRFYWGGANDQSADLQNLISIVESLQIQIRGGDLRKVQIKVVLEAGKPMIVAIER